MAANKPMHRVSERGEELLSRVANGEHADGYRNGYRNEDAASFNGAPRTAGY